MRSTFSAPLLVLLVLLAGCQGEPEVAQTDEGTLVLGAEEQTEQLVRAVAPEGRPLVIEGFQGDVTLRGTDEDVAQLTITKVGRGETVEAARRALRDVEVEETGDAETYRIQLGSAAPSVTRAVVEGTVPEKTTLRVSQESGRIDLEGLRGRLDVRQTSGPVRVAGTGDDVRVETRNGGIVVFVDVLPPGSTLELVSSNGNLEVMLPPATSANVEARTAAGTIRVDGLTFDRRNLRPSGGGSRFTGTLGRGGAAVNLRTENGTITLREGTYTPGAQPGDLQPDTLASPSGSDSMTPPDTTARTAPDAPPPMPPERRQAPIETDTTDTVSSDTTGTRR